MVIVVPAAATVAAAGTQGGLVANEEEMLHFCCSAGFNWQPVRSICGTVCVINKQIIISLYYYCQLTKVKFAVGCIKATSCEGECYYPKYRQGGTTLSAQPEAPARTASHYDDNQYNSTPRPHPSPARTDGTKISTF